MSRIGKQPIEILNGVSVTIEGHTVKVNGPKGELTENVNPVVKIEIADKIASVKPAKKTRETDSFLGLTRTLVANMVKGVADGFEKKLEFQGVGYRAAMEGSVLVMHLGFSHPVRYTPREGIEIKVEKTIITVSGFSKQLVGQTAAEIRDLKKPEPYKGKGIRYVGDHVRRKAGKTAAKGS